MAITYNDLYLNTRNRLRAAGVDSAQLEAFRLGEDWPPDGGSD